MSHKLRCLCKFEITKFQATVFGSLILSLCIPSVHILFGKLLTPVGPITLEFLGPINIEENQLVIAGITVISSLILTMIMCIEKN